MTTLLLSAIYFYSPGALANMGAVISRFVPGFNQLRQPIDFGLTLRGYRLVGDHKTVGGFLFGVLFGVLVGLIKFIWIDPHLPDLLLFELSFLSNLWLSLLLSVGAVSGDLLKSLLKRQLNVDPHKPFVPFDEIDHSLTAMLLAKIFFPISWTMVGLTVFIYIFIHATSNVIGYLLKIKKVPY